MAIGRPDSRVRIHGGVSAGTDGARNALLELWSRFLATPAGMFLEDRTSFVRRIAGPEGGGMGAVAAPGLAAIIAAAALPVIPLGPSWLSSWPLWAALAMAWTALSAAFWLLYRDSPERRRDDLSTRSGFMTPRQVRATYGARAVTSAARWTAPESYGRGAEAWEIAFPLGVSRHEEAYASGELPAMLLGPARSGKSRGIIGPLVACWPGCAIVTSTRPDVVESTAQLRRDGWTDTAGRRFGPDGSTAQPQVYVFDPAGISKETPAVRDLPQLPWSPIYGCEDPSVARIHAAALVAGLHMQGDNAMWASIATTIIQALLHAAAIDGRTIEDVYRWSRSFTDAQEAARILEERWADPERHAAAGDLAAEWSLDIEQLKREDPRTQSNKWLTVANAFSCLSVPEVRARMAAAGSGRIDMDALVSGRNTVYLLSEFRDTAGASPAGTGGFVSMFLSDVLRSAQQRSVRSPGGRLDPHLLFALDEIANIAPWPYLPQVISAGSGNGICAWTVFQSMGQAEAAYGKDTAREMWDSCLNIVLPGLKDDRTCKEISDMLGQRTVRSTERSYDGSETLLDAILPSQGRFSEREERRPVLSSDEVRRLPDGMALVMSKNSPPAVVTLVPLSERVSDPAGDAQWPA